MATATVILFVAASFLILGIKVGAKWQRTVYAEHLPTWHRRPHEADRMADAADGSPMVIDAVWQRTNLPSSDSKMER